MGGGGEKGVTYINVRADPSFSSNNAHPLSRTSHWSCD